MYFDRCVFLFAFNKKFRSLESNGETLLSGKFLMIKLLNFKNMKDFDIIQ